MISVQIKQDITQNYDHSNLESFMHLLKITETVHASVHLIHFGKMQREIWDLKFHLSAQL